MQTNKGIAPIVWVIILAIILGGGYAIYKIYNTQQTTPTTSSNSISKNKTPTQPPITMPTYSLPTSCKSEPEGTPVITSLSSISGAIGTILEIRGCNLSGFEGDLDVYFERADGQKIMLTDNFGSYSKTADSLIMVVVKEPCQQGETIYGSYSGIPSQCNFIALNPGLYKVYTKPWSKTSNTAYFAITAQ